MHEPIATQAARRIKRGWMNLRVTKIIEECLDTKTFYLEDADEGGRPYDFIAGQYLTFRFDSIAPKPLVRSYTMSGSPCQTQHSILTVKRVEGGIVSNWLCDHVCVDTVLRARGPIGRFVFDPVIDHKHLFMVAGGSGVTPFVSIIRQHLPTIGQLGSPKSMGLLVAYRSREDLISFPELQSFSATQGVKIMITLTREDARSQGFYYGRPNDEHLNALFSGQYDESTLMTCGPQALMDLAVEHGRRHGMQPEHLKTESFES